jgi:ubiquinone/menaquinone biosynthesis C-methylase UbiE
LLAISVYYLDLTYIILYYGYVEITVVNYFWNIYSWVYDAALLELMPYQNMLRLAGETLTPRQGGTYFDAGCGTGNLIANLSKINDGINIVGADSSSVMLKRAINKMVAREDSVDFYQLYLNKEIPFENNSFDGASCINVLYVLDQPVIFIKELQRVLKDKGKLILATPLNEPKLLPVLNEHIDILKVKYPKKWLFIFFGQTVRIFIPALTSILLNLFITRNQKYFFFGEKDLRTLIEKSGFQLKDVKKIYGHQVLFIHAEKC